MQTCKLKAITIPLKALILSFYVASSSVLAQTLPLPRNLIAFDSVQGEQLLLASKAKQAYWPLSVQFVTQNNQAYCGVASMVMVLNALSIPAPVAPEYSPYHVFTQENLFNNEQTRKVLAPEVVARQGMNLDQLGQLVATYPVKAKVYHGADISLKDFRKLAVESLQQPNNFILVNYLRKVLGEEKGGHISPLAAYNEQTDRFLILDVSRYKYPPIWVKAVDLWQAMATMDSVSGKTRGFVVVSRE
ncbi:MAG: phytochelatin synthase family protein [Chroococcidiopsidaceae cyanobacterium CP_BM_RX_35]|nr:phytochelatin synthase family protein [Chroococcidiopsidaceae cyanobacterium CP_BM_RX_35]